MAERIVASVAVDSEAAVEVPMKEAGEKFVDPSPYLIEKACKAK